MTEPTKKPIPREDEDYYFDGACPTCGQCYHFKSIAPDQIEKAVSAYINAWQRGDGADQSINQHERMKAALSAALGVESE